MGKLCDVEERSSWLLDSIISPNLTSSYAENLDGTYFFKRSWRPNEKVVLEVEVAILYW